MEQSFGEEKVDYNKEYTERFARAKAEAEVKGLRYEYPKKAGVGWKIHLSVVPDINNPLTAEVANFTAKKRYVFKVGRGGTEQQKGMTIYIGDRDTLEDFARELMERFGEKIPEPQGDILIDDVQIEGRVWARFENVIDLARNPVTPDGFPRYHQYGSKGLPYLGSDVAKSLWGEAPSREIKLKNARQALESDYGAFFTGTRGTSF